MIPIAIGRTYNLSLRRRMLSPVELQNQFTFVISVIPIAIGRTFNLRFRKPILYPLSYEINCIVIPKGFEPLTYRLKGDCSNQLSYEISCDSGRTWTYNPWFNKPPLYLWATKSFYWTQKKRLVKGASCWYITIVLSIAYSVAPWFLHNLNLLFDHIRIHTTS